MEKAGAVTNASFEQEAKEINARFKQAAVADKKAQNLRISAGEMLIALRPKVEAAGVGWEAWCTENIKRSYRDVQKVMALVGSSDPEAADKQAKLARNEADRARRARVGGTRAVPSPQPITAANPVIRSGDESAAVMQMMKSAWSKLNPSQRVTFINWAHSVDESGEAALDLVTTMKLVIRGCYQRAAKQLFAELIAEYPEHLGKPTKPDPTPPAKPGKKTAKSKARMGGKRLTKKELQAMNRADLTYEGDAGREAFKQKVAAFEPDPAPSIEPDPAPAVDVKRLSQVNRENLRKELAYRERELAKLKARKAPRPDQSDFDLRTEFVCRKNLINHEARLKEIKERLAATEGPSDDDDVTAHLATFGSHPKMGLPHDPLDKLRPSGGRWRTR